MKILLALYALITLTAAVVVDKWQRIEDGSLYFVEGEQKFSELSPKIMCYTVLYISGNPILTYATQFTWYEAWNECARKNMSLLAIEDAAKHQQIDKMIRKLFPTCPSLWLGANDFVADKRFVWIPTGLPVTFTNWAVGQPNQMKEEHCIFILTNTWEWHDVTCTAAAGFICEEHPLAAQKSTNRPEEATNKYAASSFSKYNSIIFNR